MKKINYLMDTMRRFNMSWVLTNQCNYACKDCITANNNANTPLNDDQIAQGLKKLTFKINELSPKACSIRLLGGEPTLIKDLAEMTRSFFEELTAQKIVFCLQTNLSQSVAYYKEFIKKIYSVKKQILIVIQTSVYPEFTNVEEFKNKIRELKTAFPTLILQIKFIADQTNYNKVNALYNQFKTEGFDVDFYPNMANIFNLKPDLSLEKTDVLNQSNLAKEKLLKEKPSKELKRGRTLRVGFEDGEELYFRNFNHLLVYAGLENMVFDGHYCTAGFNSIRIEPDGTVYRSQAPCIRLPESVLGNVVTGFDFYKEIKKCTTKIGCNCLSRIYSGVEYPEFIDKNYLS